MLSDILNDTHSEGFKMTSKSVFFSITILVRKHSHRVAVFATNLHVGHIYNVYICLKSNFVSMLEVISETCFHSLLQSLFCLRVFV